MHRYAPRRQAGEPVPPVNSLSSARRQAISYSLCVPGVLLGAAGLFVQSVLVLRSGLALLTIGFLVFEADMLAIYRHLRPFRPREGSQGSGPRTREGGNDMLPGEESALCNKNFGLLLERGERLLGLALTMMGRGEVRMKEAEFGFVAVVLGLCAKAVKTFRAIHLLCLHGLCEDAHALLRSLTEILANIKYLAKEDRDGRARQYLDYTVIQDQKMINATERNPELRGMFPDATKAVVEQQVANAKARMSEEEFKKRHDAGAWHGRKIEEVMRDVGMQSAYDLVFRLGSRAIHATDLFDHMEWDPDGGFLLKLLPGDLWAQAVLGTSNDFFLDILNQVNTIRHLGAEEQIRSALQEMIPPGSHSAEA